MATSKRAEQHQDSFVCKVSGVSVSPDGFYMLLENAENQVVPIQVTSTEEDAHAATSVESLTVLQLLSGVDMAGPVLPPECLAQIAVLCCESSTNLEPPQQALMELLDLQTPYGELNAWQRARVRLPKMSLEQVVFHTDQWKLECKIPMFPQIKTIEIVLNKAILQAAMLVEQPSQDMVVAFYSLALALRYKAPIVVRDAPRCLDRSQVPQEFPNMKSRQSLQQQTDRLSENIERGFEIHKLTGALRIAMERGDEAAAKSIRQRLDEYDSMDDLPTLEDNEGPNTNNQDDVLQ